jgi:hypothetical protein
VHGFGRLAVRLEPSVVTAPVAGRGARRDVHTALDGPALRDVPAITDAAELELRERQDHLQREAAHRRRRVEVVLG